MATVINEVKEASIQMKADYLVFENEKIVERLAEIEEFRLTVIARV